MTKRQNAKLDMYNAVLRYLLVYVALIEKVAAFQAAFNGFRNKLTILNTLIGLQSRETTAVTKDTKQLKQLMADQFAESGALLYAYAFTQSDHVLMAATKHSETQLFRMKDDKLLALCHEIRNAASTHLADLQEYGVDASTLAAMDSIMKSFSDEEAAPRNARSNKKFAGQSIDELQQGIDDLLKNSIDKMVLKYKKSDPDFYNTYQINRLIVDPRSVKTRATGITRDQHTDLPIAGVTVTARFETNVYTAVTNDKGAFNLLIPVPGSYQLSFAHASYKPLNAVPVEVVMGKVRRKNVVLAPLG